MLLMSWKFDDRSRYSRMYLYATHCDWVMVITSVCNLPPYRLLGAGADTKEGMVFQIQRSKLQVFETTNLPGVELKDTWRIFENYLARRLISFSRSKAAFQFKIVDHNKKTYLTVSLHQRTLLKKFHKCLTL